MLDKTKKYKKRAVLVGLVHKDQTEQQLQEYLDELAFLAETAGAVAVKGYSKLPHLTATFVGKGKLEEIKAVCAGQRYPVIIFDDELSGAQINNEKST